MSERARDILWDSLDELFGATRTTSERARRNRAVRELRDAGATVEEIQRTYRFCRDRFSQFTEMAICTNLSAATKQQQSVNLLDEMRRRREQREAG